MRLPVSTRTNMSGVCSIRALMLYLLTLPLLCYGQNVTGVVTNKTTGKPAVGDDVVLIGLTNNMQEIRRTKTNAVGHYSIDVPEAGMHLIRVDHQKAAYFAAVAPGATKADVGVYDVAAKVPGITTVAEVLRVDTDPRGLHVTESYLVGNASSPPRTQFGIASYDIYLPADVPVEQPIAMGPGGMPVASSPVPSGDKGHYSFIFPLRPGQTQFQVSYHLPYTGSNTFQPRVSLPTGSFTVVLPLSMKFAGSSAASFQPTRDDPSTQTFVTKDVGPSESPTFTVSGNGALPDETQAEQSTQGQNAPAQTGSPATTAATDTRPGIGLGPPIDTPDPLDKYKWWLLSGIGLCMVIGSALFLHARNPLTSTDDAKSLASLPTGLSPAHWLAGLKEELFALETERLSGKLSESDYVQQRAAFEVLLRRAMRTMPTALEERGREPQDRPIRQASSEV
jgi:hypothetical protein